MNKVDLSKVYATMASVESGPQIDIQATQKLSTNTFKIVANTYNLKDEAAFTKAIASLTEGKGRVVPGSFIKKNDLVIAAITAASVMKPLDASYTQVTANTAADALGNIWSVVTDGDKKNVVLESSDDLADILATRMASRSTHINPVQGAGFATASFNNGDLVSYVDTAKQEMAWGLVFQIDEGAYQVVAEDLIPRNISRDAVISATPRAKLPVEIAKAVNPVEATAKLSPDKLSKIITYLSKAYGPASSEMIARLRQLAGQAKGNI